MAMTAEKLAYHRAWRAAHPGAIAAANRRSYKASGMDRYYRNLELTRAIKRKAYYKQRNDSAGVATTQELIDHLRSIDPPKKGGGIPRYNKAENKERRKASMRRYRYKHVSGIPTDLSGLVNPDH